MKQEKRKKKILSCVEEKEKQFHYESIKKNRASHLQIRLIEQDWVGKEKKG